MPKKLSRVSEIFTNSLNGNAEEILHSVNESSLAHFEHLTKLVAAASEIYIIGFDGLYPLSEYMENSLSPLRKGIRVLRSGIAEYLSGMAEGALLIIMCSEKGTAPRMALGRFAADKGANVAILSVGG